MNIQCYSFFHDASTYFKTTLGSLTPLQKTIAAVTAVAIALLAACLIAYRYSKFFQNSPISDKATLASNQEIATSKESPALDILEIDSIKQLDVGNHTSLDDTLVVFDIDDVLTILSDPAFHRPNFKKHHSDAFDSVMAPLSKVEQSLAFTMPLLTTSSDLIEAEAPDFISTLQKRAKTIALTAAMGVDIDGASIENRRADELKRVGIDFSTSFPDVTDMTFSGFPVPVLGREPLFHKGIILTNENNKGEVLVRFLESIAWKPKRIGFVDDRKEHVEKVKKALNTHFPEISFIGFYFLPKWVPYASATTEYFTAQWIEVANKAKELVASKRYFPRAVETTP